MEQQQRDRIYELTIAELANPSQVVTFTDHQIKFVVQKSSDNSAKSNKASIKIFNLKDSDLKVLESDYPVAALSVGYSKYEGLKRLLVAEVTHYKTIKKGPDRITNLELSPNYTGLNHSVLSASVPPGSKVRDAVQQIRKGFGFGVVPGYVLNGTAIEKDLVYGFPLSGSPKDMLNKLANIYGFEWRVDNNTLYVNDVEGAENNNFANAPVVSRDSGLIENAYYEAGDNTRAKDDPAKKNGVKFRMLMDATIIPGQIISLQDTLISGFFKVDDVKYSGDYRGGSWFADVQCSAIEKVVKG